MLWHLFSDKDNCSNVTKLFLNCLHVKVTLTTIKNDLLSHPHYPSLLSISDVLSNYGAPSISFKSSIEKLKDVPVPFIAHIKGEKYDKDFFTVVDSVNTNSLTYYNPEKYKWEEISLENFKKKWISGILLLAEAKKDAGEMKYEKNYTQEQRIKFTKVSAFLAVPLVSLIAGIVGVFNFGLNALYPTIFLILTLLGSIIGGILLWYEIDQYNPVLQQICGASKKMNCLRILQSKASKIMGISWSSIGFTYFVGGLFTLVLNGVVNSSYLSLLAWTNALTTPYIFFSIYYQWRIAKQWCILCLSIQGILVLQLTTAVIGGWYNDAPVGFLSGKIIPLGLSYLIPFLIIRILLPAYRAAKESSSIKSELVRLKHNPQIFNALLGKQKTITENPHGLGITLGNTNAPNKIIKVCNPYCGPCAQAHIPLENLLKNNADIQLQIIFTATNDEGDSKADPVRHFLAIAEKKDKVVVTQALDDWYLDGKKNYKQFAFKYPIKGGFQDQNGKLDAMSKWCTQNEIISTPTFFVNGNQLPKIYNVDDLKYLLSV